MKNWAIGVASTFLMVGCGGLADPSAGQQGTKAQQESSLSASRDSLAGKRTELRIHQPGDAASQKGLAGTGRSTGPIAYHGGPVMLGTINMYYIWYGNWSGSPAPSILTDFATGIGGSTHFAINTTYYDGSNNHVSNSVAYAGATTDGYSQGTALNDGSIWTIVSSAISSGRLPLDANGVYFVITSPDVSETTGFCSRYCGWHTYNYYGSTPVKYSFIGDPATQCLSSCSVGVAPNGDAASDGMASVISHELEETTTDPQLSGWYTGSYEENGDKCAWTFGDDLYTAGNGQQANMHLGNRDFYIQQNWVNDLGGYCDTSGTALRTGQYLSSGQYVESTGNRFFATQQSDGNFVIYRGTPWANGGYTWADFAFGSGGQFFAIQQGDGNFVSYKGTPSNNQGYIWASFGFGSGGNFVANIHNDGHFVVYTPAGSYIWRSP